MSKKILILGVTGMLGHTLFKTMIATGKYEIYGTARSRDFLQKTSSCINAMGLSKAMMEKLMVVKYLFCLPLRLCVLSEQRERA